MRVLLQRVASASVTVDGEELSRIGTGYLLLTGVTDGDTLQDACFLAQKVANLRILEDRDGRMNVSAVEVVAAGDPFAMLVVSQFTLYADCRRGRRPSFVEAASREIAEPVVNEFGLALAKLGFDVESGVFGAEMEVSLVNDGPVTIWLDTAELLDGKSGP